MFTHSSMATQSANARHWKNNLHVVLNFYSENPKKFQPDKDTPSNDETRATQSYWGLVRRFQENDLFLEGMLLKSLERVVRHPFIHYVVYNNPGEADSIPGIQPATESRQSNCENLTEITASQGFYREMYTFVDHQTALLPKRPQSPRSAYIVTFFKAIGCIDELDRSWSYWSGADFIVENIPTALRLQRLTFHKIKQDITPDTYVYVLMCELGEALAHTNQALEFVETLNDRQCGLSSLYAIDHFF